MSASRCDYLIGAYKPLWRYAVALDDRPDLPAIPYYRKAAALAFYDESRAKLPHNKTMLLKRRLGHVEVVMVEMRDSRGCWTLCVNRPNRWYKRTS